MQVGDIAGRGTIYDEDGNLILRKDERILRKVENDDILVWKGKRVLTSKDLFHYSKEKGTMYLTTERLVFVRTPDPWLAFKSYSTPFELHVGVTDSLYAKGLKRLGLKSYVELYYREVKTFKSKKGKSATLKLEDADGVPIHVAIDRLNKNDDKIIVLERLLLQAGAKKID
jgi:hypothetical protein